jgi:hypothetical protein
MIRDELREGMAEASASSWQASDESGAHPRQHDGEPFRDKPD